MCVLVFQPTLPARGATGTSEVIRADRLISTHAPRTGSDRRRPRSAEIVDRFQPTLPARGATRSAQEGTQDVPDISTHAPRTGSDGLFISAFTPLYISTHAPRTGSDGDYMRVRFYAFHFNPRSPHGERRYTPGLGKLYP